jgi:CMP-2-keto-3-deoxyoctulosonic acid synthetase
MDSVLVGLQGTEMFVYLDDIVIYTKSLKEHKIKIERLMQRLRKANLQLQPEKCQFLRHEVLYLGHVISSEGVKPDPDKIAAKNFPTPKNPKNVKQFLGLAGYYRRFIKDFSKFAKPQQIY